MPAPIDFVFSINVYNSVPTLELQLRSIKIFVHGTYVVILNSTPEFRHLLPPLPQNVIVNPHLISKRRFHGSILKGIVSNMHYALRHLQFKHFIVLSGRNIFYRPMHLDGLKRLAPFRPLREKSGTPDDWHWGEMKNTLLAQHYLATGFRLHASAHEGLCLSAAACHAIVSFLNKNGAIAENLFQKCACVEEFALQTIATIESDGFLYIGNGCGPECDEANINIYTRKIPFLDVQPTEQRNSFGGKGEQRAKGHKRFSLHFS
jgi:hypothetical protein